MIILFAHGSPDARHRAGVEALGGRVGGMLAPEQVRVAYLQHHGPTLLEAVADADGEVVWVLPLLLSDGVHAADDVPPAVIAAAVVRPDLDWRVHPTLPPSTLSLAVIEHVAPLVQSPDPGRRGVVGVVAGSSREGALDSFEGLAAALRPAGLELVVANGPGPAIDRAVELLTCLGAADIAVVPLMFADGFLAERAGQRADRLGVPITAPIGEALGCGEAVASWIAAHVKRDTLRPPSRSDRLVHASP